MTALFAETLRLRRAYVVGAKIPRLREGKKEKEKNSWEEEFRDRFRRNVLITLYVCFSLILFSKYLTPERVREKETEFNSRSFAD